MHPEERPVAEAAARLEQTFGPAPPTAVVLGSGLGGLAARLADARRAPYGELALPQATVASHASELVCGHLPAPANQRARVAVLAGRVHLYEGREPAEVVRYVRALGRWGVRHLLLTNSVGGISPGLETGALLIVTDHINFQGRNPLFGPAFGERFPDLSRAYDAGLRRVLSEAAAAVGVPVATG